MWRCEFGSEVRYDPMAVEIRLVDNNLRYQLPTELGLLLSNLLDLDFSQNQLSGLVPIIELGRLTSLERFYLRKSATISSSESDNIVGIGLAIIYLLHGFVDGNQEQSGFKNKSLWGM
jgi:hypothetical protein